MVGYWVAEVVVVELAMVSFDVDMELVDFFGIFYIEKMVVEGMAVDIDTAEDTYAVVVGFHNYIPSNLV